MSNHSVNYDEIIQNRLKEPEYAKLFLEAALEETRRDGDQEAFLLALREVVDAQGGVPTIAQKMDVPKQSLYKTLSKHGNPRLDTLGRVLQNIGLRLSVETVK